MSYDFRMPNINGTDREMLVQIRSYLYQFIPQLQWVLNNLESSGASPQAPKGTTHQSTSFDAEAAFDALKPFITKSADIVRAYYEGMKPRLDVEYVAKSDYKAFVEKTEQSINQISKDFIITKSLNAQGWYKVGTLSGDMCAVATVTVGGVSQNDQASPSMIDIATQDEQVRTFLRVPSIVDNQISKIGVVKENTSVYGVYAYYNTANENPVSINIHIHMGTFVSEDLVASSVTDSDMLSSINVKQ